MCKCLCSSTLDEVLGSNPRIFTGWCNSRLPTLPGADCQLRWKIRFELAVVYKEEQALKKLPKNAVDPWFCEDIKLVLADMLEEQLILCMPIVSYHEQHCIAKLEFEATQPKQG